MAFGFSWATCRLARVASRFRPGLTRRALIVMNYDTPIIKADLTTPSPEWAKPAVVFLKRKGPG